MPVIRTEQRRGIGVVAATVFAALLAACAGSDMAAMVTPAAAPDAATATPAADAAPAPAARGQAARAAAAPAPPPAAAPPPPPAAPPPAAPSAKLTVEQINTECWMRADADRRLRDIDARLAYVKRCTAERTRSQ